MKNFIFIIYIIILVNIINIKNNYLFKSRINKNNKYIIYLNKLNNNINKKIIKLNIKII